jgi:hypothetical protein
MYRLADCEAYISAAFEDEDVDEIADDIAACADVDDTPTRPKKRKSLCALVPPQGILETVAG